MIMWTVTWPWMHDAPRTFIRSPSGNTRAWRGPNAADRPFHDADRGIRHTHRPGTPEVDHITVTGSGADVTVAGLTPLVTALFLAPDDFLLIQTGDGRDIVDSSGLERGVVQ